MTDTRANLRPFKDSAAASAAGKKGAETRRAKALLKQADSKALSAQLKLIRSTFSRDDLGPTAAALATHVMANISAGNIPIRHAGEAAELLRVLVDVARLEAGEATAHTLSATMTAEQVTARVAELQRQAVDAPSVIVPDATTPEPPDAGNDT